MKLYLSTTQTHAPGAWWEEGVVHVHACMARDGAHDWGHLLRVHMLSRQIWEEEYEASSDALSMEREESWCTLALATLFHDVVNVPKNSPQRALASTLSADHAVEWAKVNTDLTSRQLEGLHHTISAHSYSAGLEARTLEARVLSDADKLDALGAIGIARTFAVSGKLDLLLAHHEDPLGVKGRLHDDSRYGVDHFYCKLFELKNRMYTSRGRKLAEEREHLMRDFLDQLALEMLG